MRLVLDTNVMLSGFLWGGPPAKLINIAELGQCELFTSMALLAEFERVVFRPKFRKRLGEITLTPREAIDGYAALATIIAPASIAPAVVRDPDDDAVLACALSARADLIVSGDDDLLVLERWRDIPILNPRDALTLVRKEDGSA